MITILLRKTCSVEEALGGNKVDDREFMEWFVDSLISLDIYWNEDRDELIDGAIDKLIQAGKVRRIDVGVYERVT